MEKTIREQLFENADEKYQTFSAGLLPNVGGIIGVRLPVLRKMAKKIAHGDWQGYLKTAQDDYFEEVMLQGLVIGYAAGGAQSLLSAVADFVPKINSWSVCDSFCIGLKFVKDNRECVWQFLQSYFHSQREYEVRFAVVMLLNFFVEEEYIERVLFVLHGVAHGGYYVKMAVAWAISQCFVRFPALTMAYLKENRLDDFTFNKALQKITESLCVDKETKTVIRRMKRR